MFDVWGLVAGISPLFLLFLVIFPAAAGWLSSAWRRERPWAWWVLTPLSGLLLLVGVDDLLTVGPSWFRSPRLVFYGVLLLLLAHPDSRARIQPVRADAGLPGRQGPGG